MDDSFRLHYVLEWKLHIVSAPFLKFGLRARSNSNHYLGLNHTADYSQYEIHPFRFHFNGNKYRLPFSGKVFILKLGSISLLMHLFISCFNELEVRLCIWILFWHFCLLFCYHMSHYGVPFVQYTNEMGNIHSIQLLLVKMCSTTTQHN